MQPLSAVSMPNTVRNAVSSVSGQNSKHSMADQMKQIRKSRLQRMAMQDPSLHRKLVAVEASPLYNASGDLIQAVTTQSMGV